MEENLEPDGPLIHEPIHITKLSSETWKRFKAFRAVGKLMEKEMMLVTTNRKTINKLYEKFVNNDDDI